ncbi:hypothetical protein [Corynebacterium macclintockiae]|uniref:hypothetical protein n=2 Tax=Corynebacterium macclintockiae TaxID=2913501 RepID=UPI003EBC2873
MAQEVYPPAFSDDEAWGISPNRHAMQEFLQTSVDGEGVYRFGGKSKYRWVRVYDGEKALATFYVSERVDWKSGRGTGVVATICQAIVKKGQPPVPWRTHATTFRYRGEWGIPHDDWWNSWERKYIDRLPHEKRKALWSYHGVTGVEAEEFPELYADYESPQSYRERFNDLSDKEFLQVVRASATWLNIARDQLSAERLKNREPSRVRHVRGSSRVYPVAAPGGEYRWQFPGFKVRAGVLAEVLFALRTMGIQRVDLVDLRRAIDIYNRTSPRR